MKTYDVVFKGREINAIGIFYTIHTTVKGNDEHDALMNLYEKYDHISFPRFTEIRED